MPFAHISLRAGKTDAYRQAIFDGVYRALRETFNVPKDDPFMVMTEHDAANFRYGASYLDVARSDDLVFIQNSPPATPARWSRKKHCFRGSQSYLAQTPVSGQKTCSSTS